MLNKIGDKMFLKTYFLHLVFLLCNLGTESKEGCKHFQRDFSKLNKKILGGTRMKE